MRALSIAATGMAAQEQNVEVIANNVANINTTGFKRARAEFTDLLYQTERAAGPSTRGGDNTVPEGSEFGLGVRLAAVRELHQQGALAKTENRLDLAINGHGYFQITGANNEVLYSRAGAFNLNAEGQIVTLDGLLIESAITVPQNTSDVVINQAGEVFAIVDGGDAQPQALGQITLVNFTNEVGLRPVGGNLFVQTEASGAPIEGAPGDEGFGVLRQGYLEESNVDSVKEMTELIAAQRAYEMNSKVIQAADDMLGTVTRGIR